MNQIIETFYVTNFTISLKRQFVQSVHHETVTVPLTVKIYLYIIKRSEYSNMSVGWLLFMVGVTYRYLIVQDSMID